MRRHQRYCLGIAGLTVGIDTDCTHEPDPQFEPFLTEWKDPDFRVCFRQTDRLPEIPAQVIHEDHCYRVHPDGTGGYLRSFFDAPRDQMPYAVAYWEEQGALLQVLYLKKGVHCVSQMQNSFFHIGFESMLLRKDCLCIHAACVSTRLGGILFSGLSGIGKSTQAELWCKYRAARQINGDRPILSRKENGWLAWGSPYAGSSGCHINESCSVAAVVMLKQEKTCSLRRMTGAEAFRGIWSGLTLHTWDRSQVEKALDLAGMLLIEVPVYEFCCTPDEAAVDYLERELQKEWKK